MYCSGKKDEETGWDVVGEREKRDDMVYGENEEGDGKAMRWLVQRMAMVKMEAIWMGLAMPPSTQARVQRRPARTGSTPRYQRTVFAEPRTSS